MTKENEKNTEPEKTNHKDKREDYDYTGVNKYGNRYYTRNGGLEYLYENLDGSVFDSEQGLIRYPDNVQ
jgi:hypothetical protein